MAEEAKEPSDELRTISQPEFIEFITAKVKKGDCERCGNTNWLILKETDEEVNILPFMSNERGINPDAHVGVIFTGCSNCGNIRLYMRRTVRDWLDKKSAPADSEGGK